MPKMCFGQQVVYCANNLLQLAAVDSRTSCTNAGKRRLIGAVCVNHGQ